MPKFKGLLTLHSRGSRSTKHTEDIEAASGPHERTSQNKSGQYLELDDEPFKPALIAAYSDPIVNPPERNLAGSPHEPLRFFKEGPQSGDQN